MHTAARTPIRLCQRQNNLMSGSIDSAHGLCCKFWGTSKNNFHEVRLALTRQLFGAFFHFE